MKHLLVHKNIRLLTALKKISLAGEKTLIVVNSKNVLQGTISDGDIRRNILRSNNLNNKIDKIYNTRPTYITEGNYKKSDIKKIFLKEHFDLLPIVNKSKIVVDYITWRSFLSNESKKNNFSKIKTIVIMAGGEGTRLKPFTDLLPKPLVPLKDKPIIDHIIDRFSKNNVKNFILTVRSKSKILKAYFDEKKYKNLKFIDENKPLGTVGGLSLLNKKIKEDFLLTNCDILTEIDLEGFYNFHKSNNNILSLVVSAKKFSVPYGVCTVDNSGIFSAIKEKPFYNFFVNVGLYLISPKALQYIPKNKALDMTSLIKILKKKKLSVGVYPIQDGEWIDVGQWSEYKKAFEKF
tara:strand:- start:5 stop:1051 length:1047 start_codon:yes stop_codon:yes gene_type:complete